MPTLDLAGHNEWYPTEAEWRLVDAFFDAIHGLGDTEATRELLAILLRALDYLADARAVQTA